MKLLLTIIVLVGLYALLVPPHWQVKTCEQVAEGVEICTLSNKS